MSKIQIKSTQIKSLSVKNEQIAADAAISLSKIDGGVDLQNRVGNLENDAFVTREVPSGPVDGSNAVFTLANSPVAGSEQVYLNGLLQDPGEGNSYTISGGTITFASAPLSGDEIHVSYATGNYMVAPGGSGGSGGVGGSAIVYQDAEFIWNDNNSGSVRSVTHNFGRRPDLVEVWQYYGGQWLNSLPYDSNGGTQQGWLVNPGNENSETVINIGLFRSYGYTNNPCRIRLYWFTDTDVANFSAAGGFVNAISGGGSGAGFTYTDSPVFAWPGNTSGNPTVQTYTHNHGTFPDKIEVLSETASGGWVTAVSVHAAGSSWYGCFVGDSSQNEVSVNFYGSYLATTNTKIRCFWYN